MMETIPLLTFLFFSLAEDMYSTMAHNDTHLLGVRCIITLVAFTWEAAFTHDFFLYRIEETVQLFFMISICTSERSLGFRFGEYIDAWCLGSLLLVPNSPMIGKP